jgi:hypothetical protein
MPQKWVPPFCSTQYSLKTIEIFLGLTECILLKYRFKECQQETLKVGGKKAKLIPCIVVLHDKGSTIKQFLWVNGINLVRYNARGRSLKRIDLCPWPITTPFSILEKRERMVMDTSEFCLRTHLWKAYIPSS